MMVLSSFYNVQLSLSSVFLEEDKTNDKIFHLIGYFWGWSPIKRKVLSIFLAFSEHLNFTKKYKKRLIILGQNSRIPTIVGWCRLSVNVPNCSLIFWQKRELSHVQRKSKNLGPYVVRRRGISFHFEGKALLKLYFAFQFIASRFIFLTLCF